MRRLLDSYCGHPASVNEKINKSSMTGIHPIRQRSQPDILQQQARWLATSLKPQQLISRIKAAKALRTWEKASAIFHLYISHSHD